MNESYNEKGKILLKFVISGLDNAGKTSYLIALRRKYNFYERVKKLKPTIKIDYSSFTFLNYEISCWDMGGQARYRSIYVNNPIYFSETNYLYFIIDIQDELRLETAVNYLSELLDIYRELNYSNEIIICFSKYDPKYRNSEEFADRVEMVKNLILTQNKDVIFKFFKTSIYDISSVSKAMSYSLNKLLNLERVNQKLNEFVTDYGCGFAILYTNSGLIIADCYAETMDGREFEDIISTKISDDLEFFQRLADEKVVMDARLTVVDERMEYVKMYKIESEGKENLFYLGVSTPQNRLKDVKEELEKFNKELEIILQK